MSFPESDLNGMAAMNALYDPSNQSDTSPGLSVVILSKNADNLAPCVQAIVDNERIAGQPGVEDGTGLRIVVVDDGVDWARYVELSGCNANVPTDQFVALPYISEIVPGIRPFVFARNANLGIVASGNADVVLVNDDALLRTKYGFSGMQLIASSWWPRTGILAATCNNVGNLAQHPRPIPFDYIGFRREERMVCFVCVLIPRATIEMVGPLDEDFTSYGVDDDDYCLRVTRAGLGIAITDLCYVDHGSLTSSYRGEAGVGGDFRPNLRIFIQKYGTDNRGLTREQSPWRDLWPK